MTISAALFAVSVAVAAQAATDNGTILRGPVPSWVATSELMPVPDDATGMMFVRRQENLIHLDGSGMSSFANSRVRILHANALQIGNIGINWNPSAGAPTVHFIRIHRDGGTIDVLKDAKFEILRREDRLEEASLDGILTAVLQVPDLRVGDDLEFAATTRSTDPTLGSHDAGVLVLAPAPPPGRYLLGISWVDGQQPHLKMSPSMAAVARRGPRSIAFQYDNPEVMMPPKDAPPRYDWQRVVQFSDYSSWAELSKQVAPLFTRAAKLLPTSPLKAEAKRIAAAHSTPIERANAALELVQKQIRYVYVGFGDGNFTPAAADVTWKRRYGDCKAKTAMLLGLLAELGIDAEPVLVNSAGADDGLDERLPNAALFDHVLVRARIAGADYWLDGTLPPVARPQAAPMLPYRWVLPLTAQGSSIEPLQWHPMQQPNEIVLYDIDATSGFDLPARFTQTSISRGIESLKSHLQFSSLSQSQLLNAFRSELIGDYWQSIDEVKWTYDVPAQAGMLIVRGSVALDWDDDGGQKKSLALPGGGFSPPEKRLRPEGQDRTAPFYANPEYSCHVTTVRLPKSTSPSQWSYNSSFDQEIFGRTYHRAFELREGAIRMIRGSRVERREIDAAIASRDNGKIAGFDNSKAMIYFDPASKPDKRSGGRVPATDEIDWTARDLPCLGRRAGA